MKGLRAHLDAVMPELVEAWETRGARRARLAPEESTRLAARILDPQDRDARTAFTDLVRGNVVLTDLIDVLSMAAAERLLRFDPAIDADPTHQDNWLFVTHPLTFVHALREALPRATHPDFLRACFFALEFVRRSHRLDLPEEARVDRSPDPARATAHDVVEALRDRDAAAAVGRIAAWSVRGADDLEPHLRGFALEGPATLPIYLAHVIKTTRAALDEWRAITHPAGSTLPLLALARYLASPAGERGLTSAVHDAVQLVVHGNLPKRLAS